MCRYQVNLEDDLEECPQFSSLTNSGDEINYNSYILCNSRRAMIVLGNVDRSALQMERK